MDLSTEALLFQVRKLETLNQNLTFRISRLAKLLEIGAGPILEGSGVNLTGYRIMLVVGIFEEISVSDLAKLMLIDRAQISRAASDLIKAGLIEPRPDATSRRKKLLALTAPGQDLLDGLKPKFDVRQAEIEALFSATDLDAFSSGIDEITRLLTKP